MTHNDWKHNSAGQRHNGPHPYDPSNTRGAPSAAPKRNENPNMASKNRSDGDGSIYQRHDHETCPPLVDKVRPPHKCQGKWVGVRVTGWRDGRPIRRKVSATSKSGAAAKLRRLDEELERGMVTAGRPVTVEKWMTYWLEEIVPAKNRPNTVRTYRTYVTRYIIPLLGHHRLDRLTAEHISDAWRQLMTTGSPGQAKPKPLSSTSAHQAHVILSRALKVAMSRGYVNRNVATYGDAPSVRNQPIEVLDKAQAQAVIAAAHGKRNAARYTVAFSLGLRQGEALGLRWSDVDLERGTLTVRRSLNRVTGEGLRLGPTKSGRERTIALPGPLLAEIKAHRVTQNAERLAAGNWWDDGDYVFTKPDGRPHDGKDDWRLWRALLDEAGVPHVRLHAARHTAATMLLALGVPVKVAAEILGHTKTSITEGYQHRVDDLHVAAAEQLAAAWWD
jgi:integrase